MIDTLGNFHYLFHLVLNCVDFNLDLIKDCTKFLMQFPMQDNTKMLKGETFFNGCFTNPDPHDITLTDMHNTLNVVHQMMELTL